MNQPSEPHLDPSARAHPVLRALPIAFTVVIVLYLLFGVYRATQPQTSYRFDLDTFGSVPVSQDGRVKPLDTVARNALLQVSQKQSLKDEMLLPQDGGETKPAIQWLAELMSGRPESFERRVIRIDDPDVLALLGKTTEDGKLFSLNDLNRPTGAKQQPAIQEIDRLAREAQDKRDDLRSKFEEHVIGVRRQFAIMLELQAMTGPFVVPPAKDGEDWRPVINSAQSQALHRPEPAAMWLQLKAMQQAEQSALTDEEIAVRLAALEQQIVPHKLTWLRMMTALQHDKPQAFNTALDEHLTLKRQYVPAKAGKAAFEQGYNRYAPFSKGIALYILAALLGLFAMLLRPVLPKAGYTALWRSGMGVLLVVFVLHTAALVIRIWLQGRPPVTNLYSSAVFIGWGIVGGAIILEKITRLGVASLAASAAGVSTLLVALHLSKDGDTMGVMQAVLDSNFWLGTHVITITLGYSATFLAGFIAILYIIFGMTTSLMDRKMGRAMSGMVYAVVCFALVFSFIGTVLGGIWADQSWGRFWGWDPKENGAILIVLMNAIILHARWGHLVKDRGIMVMAVAGNIITCWSWFGTNLMGVGLHSYGFMDGAMTTLKVVVANHMLIMAAALVVPTASWYASYRLKHPPLFAPVQQITIGGALLFIGLAITLGMLTLSLLGMLSIYAWFAGWLLLFMMATGLGQLIEGLQRYCAGATVANA